MAYNVRIDLTRMADSLHSMEQGNPVRNVVVPALYQATALCNMVRLTAGAAMLRGVRSIPKGNTASMSAANEKFKLEIQRLKD